MTNIPLAELDHLKHVVHQENRSVRVSIYFEASEADFEAAFSHLLATGCEQRETYTQGTHHFSVFWVTGCGVFVNYYDTVHELRIVQEE